MKVIAILAAGKNNELGKNNNLLWNLPRDMQFFKETTWGHTVITGRKNYESIPEKYRPLPGRNNLVVTQNTEYNAPGTTVINSIESALKKAEEIEAEKCFIIGGGQIYQYAFEQDLIDEVLLTRVDANFDADVFLEGFKTENWYLKKELFTPADSKNAYNLYFQTWVKP